MITQLFADFQCITEVCQSANLQCQLIWYDNLEICPMYAVSYTNEAFELSKFLISNIIFYLSSFSIEEWLVLKSNNVEMMNSNENMSYITATT